MPKRTPPRTRKVFLIDTPIAERLKNEVQPKGMSDFVTDAIKDNYYTKKLKSDERDKI